MTSPALNGRSPSSVLPKSYSASKYTSSLSLPPLEALEGAGTVVATVLSLLVPLKEAESKPMLLWSINATHVTTKSRALTFERKFHFHAFHVLRGEGINESKNKSSSPKVCGAFLSSLCSLTHYSVGR